jgi:hypothetical protein
MNQMVSLVCLEYLMMDHGMSLESVSEIPDRTMHHMFMKRPLEERGKNYADRETREAPN